MTRFSSEEIQTRLACDGAVRKSAVKCHSKSTRLVSLSVSLSCEDVHKTANRWIANPGQGTFERTDNQGSWEIAQRSMSSGAAGDARTSLLRPPVESPAPCEDRARIREDRGVSRDRLHVLRFDFYTDAFAYSLFSAWDSIGSVLAVVHGMTLERRSFYAAASAIKTRRTALGEQLLLRCRSTAVERHDFRSVPVDMARHAVSSVRFPITIMCDPAGPSP